MLGSILLSMANYRKFQVEKWGTIVEMTIEELPEICIGTKVKHYTKISYHGHIFIKQVGTNFCNEHKVGDVIQIRFKEGSNIILFPRESTITVFYMFGAFGLIGLGLIVHYFRKQQAS